MTTGKEWKLILLFTLPIMAGNLLQQLYNVIDGIIVGNYVSETAFASVTTCQPLTVLYLALAMGLSVGVGVSVAQFYGAGKKDELPVAIDTALLLLGTCGLVISLIGIIFSPFLLSTLLNVPETYLPLSITYMRIYSAGLFFQFLYNGIAATLRGFGDSKATLYFLLITMILNTALTFTFVLVIPWGVAGAAFSTVLSQIVCVSVSFYYLRKKFPYVKAGRHWDKKIASTMAKLGLPIAIQMGIVSFGNGSMQRLVNGFGSSVPGIVAAYGAAIRLDMFMFVPVMGFQSGLANFTGQNIGAGRLDRVKRGLVATLIMSMSATIVLCVLFNIFAESVVGFFGLADSSLQIGTGIVKFVTMFTWMFSAYMTLGGLLQGAGDTVVMSATTICALAVRIVVGYLSVYMSWLDHSAAWVTNPIGWFVAITIAYTRFFTGGWKKKAVAGKLKHGG